MKSMMVFKEQMEMKVGGIDEPHLPHDGDGSHSLGPGHAVLHQVVHVLIIEQADQVEGAEAGGTAQGQVPDHHGAGGGRRKEAEVVGEEVGSQWKLTITVLFF